MDKNQKKPLSKNRGTQIFLLTILVVIISSFANKLLNLNTFEYVIFYMVSWNFLNNLLFE